ncbi:MAG: hypothetical protein HYW23_02825 [Candidatus Aenigmarchaeota archaeon]|nr:hypothetical protein [Candidatus Aenigmarchaeota archaeon]
MTILLPGADRTSAFLERFGGLSASIQNYRISPQGISVSYKIQHPSSDGDVALYIVTESHDDLRRRNRVFVGNLPGYTTNEKPAIKSSGNKFFDFLSRTEYLALPFKDVPNLISLCHSEFLQGEYKPDLNEEWKTFLSSKKGYVENKVRQTLRLRLMQYMNGYPEEFLRDMENVMVQAALTGKKSAEAIAAYKILDIRTLFRRTERIVEVLQSESATMGDFLGELDILGNAVNGPFSGTKDELVREFLTGYLPQLFSHKPDALVVSITNCEQVPFP